MIKLCIARGRMVLAGAVAADTRNEVTGVVAVIGRRLVEGEVSGGAVWKVEFMSRKRVLVAEVRLRLAHGALLPVGRWLCINCGATGGRETSDLARQIAAYDFCELEPVAARGAPPPDRARGWRVQWIIPDFDAGAGGMMNVFMLAKQLELAGHRNTFWIQRGTKHADPRAYVAKHFTELNAEFRALHPRGVDKVEGDVVVATNDQSAYFARAVGRVAAKCYLVQDYEPYFYPMGTDHFFSRNTYRFGFKPIVAGAWLRAMMEGEGCENVRVFEFACDEKVYFLGDRRGPARDHDPRRHIAFYARASTPRRAVPLGLQAFARLARRRTDFVVHLFGQSHAGLALPFSHVDHGVLSPVELGELYRSCDVGVVFSATNHSIAPLEMMACGLPVVELEGDQNALVYPADALLLAPPEPEAIAMALERVFDDPVLAASLRAGGLAHAAGRTWERSGKAVEAAIGEALREARVAETGRG
jgi:O-antigen biosynthesis protein